jgi:hypothetical protein
MLVRCTLTLARFDKIVVRRRKYVENASFEKIIRIFATGKCGNTGNGHLSAAALGRLVGVLIFNL